MKFHRLVVSSVSDLHPRSGWEDAKSFERCGSRGGCKVWNSTGGIYGARLFVGVIVRTGTRTGSNRLPFVMVLISKGEIGGI